MDKKNKNTQQGWLNAFTQEADDTFTLNCKHCDYKIKTLKKIVNDYKDIQNDVEKMKEHFLTQHSELVDYYKPKKEKTFYEKDGTYHGELIEDSLSDEICVDKDGCGYDIMFNFNGDYKMSLIERNKPTLEPDWIQNPGYINLGIDKLKEKIEYEKQRYGEKVLFKVEINKYGNYALKYFPIMQESE